MVTDRIIEAIRNLEHGEEINIDDGAIKIRKVDALPCGYDNIDFSIMTDYKDRRIAFGIDIPKAAIMEPTFDLVGHLRERMADAMLQHLKKKRQ